MGLGQVQIAVAPTSIPGTSGMTGHRWLLQCSSSEAITKEPQEIAADVSCLQFSKEPSVPHDGAGDVEGDDQGILTGVQSILADFYLVEEGQQPIGVNENQTVYWKQDSGFPGDTWAIQQ